MSLQALKSQFFHSKLQNEIISIILSSARLLATAGIFFFHIFGMANLNNKNIDFISILIFCFLSGFLGSKVNMQPHKWIIKRFFSIMIPYWFVIIPAVIINRIIHYKDTTLLMDIITILGGNLFLNNPVYVIAWYITFVLILYFFLYIQSVICLPKILIWTIGYFVISHFLHKQWYFLSFAIGYFSSMYIFCSYKIDMFQTKIGLFLFNLGKYCYSFFLVHGGVLVFLYYLLKLSMFYSILLGFISSSCLSFLLVRMSNPLIIRLVNKVLQWTPVSLVLHRRH